MKLGSSAMQLLLLLAVAVFAIGAHAQTYCSAGPSITTDSNIAKVEGPGFSYSPPCPGVAGVDDQTSKTAGISNGGSISVTFGSCDNNYQNAGQLWIDFNRNGVFESSESMGSWQGMPESTHAFPITIPSGYSGKTRARVMMQEGGEPPLNPCEEFSWGAVVDFSVSTSGGGSGGGGGGSDGLSGGSVFLIIILVLVVVYIIGGCVYNRKKKGTTGMIESCPNNQFWMIIPGLVKDGCIFTNRRCVQPTIAKITGKSVNHNADYEEL